MDEPHLLLLRAAVSGDLQGVTASLSDERLSPSGKNHALGWAAENGHLHVVQWLLAAGAAIHFNDDYALCWASANGHLPVVRCLLDAGANIHAQDGEALLLASCYGHSQVVSLLREKSANIKLILENPSEFSQAVQVAAFSTGRLGKLSIGDCARKGACPEALCVLLQRKGLAELAVMIKATQILDPLAPEERAALLENMMPRKSRLARVAAWLGVSTRP